MTRCPKCGNDRIAGPVYHGPPRRVGRVIPMIVSGDYEERMVYTCMNCGYESSNQPLDARGIETND